RSHDRGRLGAFAGQAPAGECTPPSGAPDCFLTGLPAASREPVNHAEPVSPDALAMSLQVCAQITVVAEPPHRGRREQQELGSAPDESLQLFDSVRAIGGMVAGISAVFRLRKIPALAPIKLEQIAVAPAHDGDRSPGRNVVVHNLANMPDELLVVLVRDVIRVASSRPRGEDFLLQPRGALLDHLQVARGLLLAL